MPGPQAEFPQRRRFIYSAKSFSLLEGPDLMTGFISMTVNASVEGRTRQRGNSGKSRGKPRGEFKVEGELVLGAESYFDYVKANPAILTLGFDFTGTFLEGDRNDSVSLVGLDFNGFDLPIEGTDATEVTLKWEADDFLINGVSVFEDADEAAGAA